ncbi:MAG: D-2-hydroxyacid dehydrogenase [Gammaproteobacteria bacterium]|nr:D-2-hydroxyacid dehydrogenase [Gammaproteobacteria bacterium]MBU1646939.1 D-2-hydroxyacid dehydrogenase [Gammaproteobacteria bacterium]MBU1972451.1 D-2-hydroxyacid dehydrogenase [Gammaproteobacteria bacterium]
MNPHRIVYLERDSIRAVLPTPTFPHVWEEYPFTAPDQVFERIAAASIVITNKVQLRADLLARLPNIEFIACAATGTDNVDLDWCREHGIPVSNIRGYAVNTVPEHALALMLALRRQLLAYRADVQAGRWQQAPMFCCFDHPVRDLHGSTLGLIGRGSLGQAMAGLAAALGMRVLWGERKGAPQVREDYVSFETLLAKSDAISLHCPLTADTRGMFGEAELRAMKRDAILINTARGGLVDEAALVRALTEGWIAGAGFDVLSQEPPVGGNPLLAPELLALPNFILTPHMAWASDPAMQGLAEQLIENIEAFARGEARNRVA